MGYNFRILIPILDKNKPVDAGDLFALLPLNDPLVKIVGPTKSNQTCLTRNYQCSAEKKISELFMSLNFLYK